LSQKVDYYSSFGIFIAVISQCLFSIFAKIPTFRLKEHELDVPAAIVGKFNGADRDIETICGQTFIDNNPPRAAKVAYDDVPILDPKGCSFSSITVPL
jgi:hypothetical protein